MKKENVKKVLIGASIVGVMGVAGIMAYFTDTATVKNNLSMGIVDIDLKEYTLDENGEKVERDDLTNVLPGQVINKIPEIKCVEGAVDCYIRAKVEISCDDKTLENKPEMLGLDQLNVDESKWFYCEEDGYFYYKTILTDKDEAVELFSEVTIPETLKNEWSLANLSIDVKVDAIQSENFTPNFAEDSTNPWPGIEEDDIEECIYPEHVKQ